MLTHWHCHYYCRERERGRSDRPLTLPVSSSQSAPAATTTTTVENRANNILYHFITKPDRFRSTWSPCSKHCIMSKCTNICIKFNYFSSFFHLLSSEFTALLLFFPSPTSCQLQTIINRLHTEKNSTCCCKEEVTFQQFWKFPEMLLLLTDWCMVGRFLPSSCFFRRIANLITDGHQQWRDPGRVCIGFREMS